MEAGITSKETQPLPIDRGVAGVCGITTRHTTAKMKICSIRVGRKNCHLSSSPDRWGRPFSIRRLLRLRRRRT